MDRNFGGVIWTNHALERLKERGIKQGDAWVTFQNPDQSRRGQKGWVFYKTWGNEKIEVVASQNEKKKWVILSVWSRPVYKGKFAHVERQKDLCDRILEFLLGRFKK